MLSNSGGGFFSREKVQIPLKKKKRNVSGAIEGLCVCKKVRFVKGGKQIMLSPPIQKSGGGVALPTPALPGPLPTPVQSVMNAHPRVV